MQNFVFSGLSLILIPERDASISPTDSKRLENWMPFQIDSLCFTSRNFKIWDLNSFFVDEEHSGFIGGNGKDHVEVVVAPC